MINILFCRFSNYYQVCCLLTSVWFLKRISILGSFCSWVTFPKESLSGKTTLHNWVPRPFLLPSLVLATPWKFCPKCFSDRCHFKYFSLSETTIFTRCQVGSEPQLLPNGGRPEILDVSSSLGGSTHISGFRIWNLLLRSLKESWYPVKFSAGWEMDYLPVSHFRAGTSLCFFQSEGSHTILPLNSKA